MPDTNLYTIINANKKPIPTIYLLGTVVGAVLRQASSYQMTQESLAQSRNSRRCGLQSPRNGAKGRGSPSDKVPYSNHAAKPHSQRIFQ